MSRRAFRYSSRKTHKKVAKIKDSREFSRDPDQLSLPVMRRARMSSFLPMVLENVCAFNGTYNETSATGHADTVLRGNNPTDPYFAAGGEELAGIDEMFALYSNLRVLSCECAITVQNLDASHGLTVIVLPSLVTTDLSNSTGTPAQPFAKTVLVQHPTEKSIRMNVPTSLMAGRRRGSDLDDDWVCLAGASPTREWYYHLVFNGPIGVAALNVRYSVTLRYRCEWYGLKYLSET